MTRRRAAGAAILGIGVGVAGGVVLGIGRPGEAQDRVLRAPTIGEETPRARAAQQIAELLRAEGAVDPGPIIASLPEIRELAERRRAIAEELREFALVKFVEPPSPTAQRGTFHAALEDYMTWSSRHLDATLELLGSDEERRSEIASEVAKLRQVETIYRELAQDDLSPVTPQNLLALEFFRLGVEMKLARFVGEQ